MITDTQFIQVGGHIIVTGKTNNKIALNDMLTCQDNDSVWQVVGLGRKELTTPQNQVGLTLKNIKGELPNNGAVLI
ncbi:Uncharacterised protein [Moraxella lacunata]|uniref:Uncharacterized protein n=1 Tax=Moraxella lacunata TaxID=477 RepID=A0A378TUH3_MORLA|nr:hypothetical protein [Moraxella lacunata]STZ63924.1 Uncharacterised protein [Moraxella lacunata]